MLGSHIRNYTRSCDEQKIMLAVGHLRAHVDAKTRAVTVICEETERSLGSSEWERWEEREPALAKRTAECVRAYLEEARAGGDWMRAAGRCMNAS